MDLDDYRQRFRDLDTMELVELWEESMPDPVRELLLAEIDTRHYRVKSLPPPPPAPSTSPVRAAALGSPSADDTPQPNAEPSSLPGITSPTERDRAQVGSGAKWIMALAIIHLVSALVAAYSAYGERETYAAYDEGEIVTWEGTEYVVEDLRVDLWILHAIDVGSLLLVSALFLGLWFWARNDPKPALILALSLFVALHLLLALQEPATLFSGIILKFFVLVGLLSAIRAASNPAISTPGESIIGYGIQRDEELS